MIYLWVVALSFMGCAPPNFPVDTVAAADESDAPFVAIVYPLDGDEIPLFKNSEGLCVLKTIIALNVDNFSIEPPGRNGEPNEGQWIVTFNNEAPVDFDTPSATFQSVESYVAGGQTLEVGLFHNDLKDVIIATTSIEIKLVTSDSCP